MVSLKIVINFSRFKPALNWNRFLSDLSRGSNSSNIFFSRFRGFSFTITHEEEAQKRSTHSTLNDKTEHTRNSLTVGNRALPPGGSLEIILTLYNPFKDIFKNVCKIYINTNIRINKLKTLKIPKNPPRSRADFFSLN